MDMIEDPSVSPVKLVKNTDPFFDASMEYFDDDMNPDPNAGPPTTDNDPYMRARAYTPDTIKTVFSQKPDISMYCGECKQYVDLRGLKEHKTFHKSLEVMKYKANSKPESIEALLKRRRAIIKKLRKDANPDSPVAASDLQKVNDAYEFLKSDIEDTYEAFRRIRENVHVGSQGIALNCSAPCALAVGACSDANERWKSYMEDTRVFQDHFGNDPNKSFFAIYDGHHGRFAAEVAANELHHALLNYMEKFDPRTKCTCTFNMADSYDISQYELHSRPVSSQSTIEKRDIHEESSNVIQQIISTCEDKLSELENMSTGKSIKSKSDKKNGKLKDPFSQKMGDAFLKAHRYTDHVLSWGKDENSRVRWSGCSTLACVIQSENEEGMEVPIEEEQGGQETGRSGKSVMDPPLKLGTIHLANAGNSRMMLVRGNKAYKLSKEHSPKNPKEYDRVIKLGGNISESDKEKRVNGVLSATRGLGNHGDIPLKKAVTIEPYTTSVQIDQYAQFLVLATNGLWEVLSEDEVAALLLQVFPENHVPVPSRCSTSIQRLFVEMQNSNRRSASNQSDTNLNRLPPRVIPTGSESSVSIRPDTGNSRRSRPNTGRSTKSVTIADEVTNIEENETKVNGQTQDGDQPPAENGNSVKQSNSKSVPEVLVREATNVGTVEETSLTLDTGYQSIKGDLVTEAGDGGAPSKDNLLDVQSQVEKLELESGTESLRDGESGNEADIDTVTDGLTLPSDSRLSGRIPSRLEMQREFAKALSERLVHAALLAGSKDNITAMVVLLPGCGL